MPRAFLDGANIREICETLKIGTERIQDVIVEVAVKWFNRDMVAVVALNLLGAVVHDQDSLEGESESPEFLQILHPILIVVLSVVLPCAARASPRKTQREFFRKTPGDDFPHVRIAGGTPDAEVCKRSRATKKLIEAWASAHAKFVEEKSGGSSVGFPVARISVSSRSRTTRSRGRLTALLCADERVFPAHAGDASVRRA